MIAPSMTALSAVGPAAAAVNSGWCNDAPPASTATIGWMPGSSWVTLPMSVLPSGSAASSALFDGRSTEPRHLGAHGFGQPGIGFERVVHRLGLLDAVVAAGGDRTGQEAVAHLGFQIGQRRRIGGTHRVLQFGVRGDDVGDLPAVGDDAVHLLPGCQLLAQQPDRHLRDGHRVGGVDPQERRG